MIKETLLELNEYCPDKGCPTQCKGVLTRISNLPCADQLKPRLMETFVPMNLVLEVLT